MRILPVTLTMLSLVALAGCADPENTLLRSHKAGSSGGDDSQAPGSSSSPAVAKMTINGHITNDGGGSTTQGMAGANTVETAKTVDVMALHDNGELVLVGSADVQPGGTFTAPVPAGSSPTGIFILRLKDIAGAVVGSGVVNGLPAFVQAFTVDAVVDTVTSFKAEILVTLAKGGVPGVQNYLNVIDAYVNAQLVNTITTASVVTTDLTTLIGATSDAIVAAGDVIVAALAKVGIPIDLSALQKAEAGAAAGVEGVVKGIDGALASGATNLVASLQAAAAKVAAPIDQAIFNAVVNGGAAFTASYKKGTGGGGGYDSSCCFAAIQAAFWAESQLTCQWILDMWTKGGGSGDLIAAVKYACEQLKTAVWNAKSSADLAAAKTAFTNALLGKDNTPAAKGILGLIAKAVADLQTLLTDIEGLINPLTADLDAAFATLDPDQIGTALTKFDIGAKALPGKLKGSLSDADAAAISAALSLIQKQVTQ